MYQDEVLALLGCSRPTLNREVAAGSLPPGRYIDGHVCWLESEIEAYVEALPRQRFTGKVGRPKKYA